jgi:DNA-binding transcriptional MocR family regulator
VALNSSSNPPEIRVQPEDLAEILGDWTARPGPLYLRLSTALADAVAYGLMAPGSRLPAERRLARHLRVSRGTVVAAYEALRTRGDADTRGGSGTYLRRDGTGERHRSPLLSRLVAEDQAPIDLAVAAPQSLGALPDIAVRLSQAARLVPAHGYAPLGASRLRSAIAEHLTTRRGVPTRADEVVVTAGGQGALSMIASALVAPGDRVLVEAPTYPGAIEIFARAGAELQGIERDHAGPTPASLERALASRPARLIYLVPTCHNPTGTVISEPRRHELLRIAAAWRVPVIEDTVMADLIDRAPPDLARLDGETVMSVGSLSKCCWGGLRIGWIRASPEQVLRLGRLRAALDLGSSALDQAAALEVFDDFDAITASVRELAGERVGVLAEELTARLPEWAFALPRGGWSVWVSMPAGSADELAQLALRYGVAIASGTSAAPDDRFAGHLRLSAGAPPELLRRGVALLAQAWQELCAAPLNSAAAQALPV